MPACRLRKTAALPALFASMRIAAPLALIGALLAEWLATGQGLGYMMLQSMTMFEIDQLWSAVAGAASTVTVAAVEATTAAIRGYAELAGRGETQVAGVAGAPGADGDGRPNICGFADSLFSAAHYLKALGATADPTSPATQRALQRYGTNVTAVVALAR